MLHLVGSYSSVNSSKTGLVSMGGSEVGEILAPGNLGLSNYMQKDNNIYITVLLGWRGVKVRDHHTLDVLITNVAEVLHSAV